MALHNTCKYALYFKMALNKEINALEPQVLNLKGFTVVALTDMLSMILY